MTDFVALKAKYGKNAKGGRSKLGASKVRDESWRFTTDAEKLAEARAMVDAGYNNAAIQKRLGLTKTTAARWVAQYKFEVEQQRLAALR